MTTTYNKASPYAATNKFGQFLDLLEYRAISKKSDDVSYTIDRVYKYRPDMLAYDLYGDSALWWVFIARNPNVLKDPVFGFKPGVTIYIPKKETLVAELGI
jgi:alpha-L-fucosidase